MADKEIRRRGQPRYPCPDASPFLPMHRHEFADEENGPYVFWADVPEMDVLANEPDIYLQPYSVPRTFPKRHHHIRVPRCVRIATIGDVGEKDGGPTHDAYVDIRESYRPFVESVKNLCQSFRAGIYFQWVIGDPVLYTLPFPDFTPETLGPYAELDGTNRNDFDTTMLDEGCVILGETITFSIVDVLTPSAYVAAFADPPESQTTFRFGEAKRLTIDIAGYWNKMREHQKKMKWIFQSNTSIDYYPQDVFGNEWDAQQQYHANFFQELAANLQTGWEVGPAYSSNVGYVESVIRDFWNL